MAKQITAKRTSEDSVKGYCDYLLSDGSKITNVDKMPPKVLAVVLASQGYTTALELIIKEEKARKKAKHNNALPPTSQMKALPLVEDTNKELATKLDELVKLDNRELRAVKLHEILNDVIEEKGIYLAHAYKKLYAKIELHHDIDLAKVVKTHKKTFSTYNTGTVLKLEALSSRLTPKVLVNEIKVFFNL